MWVKPYTKKHTGLIQLYARVDQSWHVWAWPECELDFNRFCFEWLGSAGLGLTYHGFSIAWLFSAYFNSLVGRAIGLTRPIAWWSGLLPEYFWMRRAPGLPPPPCPPARGSSRPVWKIRQCYSTRRLTAPLVAKVWIASYKIRTLCSLLYMYSTALYIREQ